MNFANVRFKNLHDQNVVGNKKTNLLEQKIMGMGKVIIEKGIGNFETNEQVIGMGEGKIEKGVDSRYMMSMRGFWEAKSTTK